MIHGLGFNMQREGLSINVLEANDSTADIPLGSASSISSTDTLVNFDTDHIYAKRTFLPMSSDYQWQPVQESPSKSRRKWIVLLFACCAVCYWWKMPKKVQTVPTMRTNLDCNPFEERGMLHINTSFVEDNFWLPHHKSCLPSLLINQMRMSNPSKLTPKAMSQSMSWLRDKTVVVLGDTIDSHHVQDFCVLAEGKIEWISSQHGASPAPFRNGVDEWLKTDGEHVQKLSRPFTCTIERYNFMLISLYHYGVSTTDEYGQEWFKNSQAYYAPFSLTDRIQHILTPILRAYRRNRPELVSYASSFVDAQQLALEQERRGGGKGQTSLDKDLISRYAERVEKQILDLLRLDLFSNANLLWRTAHIPKGSSQIPADVVQTLDDAAETVIEDLTMDSPAPWWTSSAELMSPFEKEEFSRRVRVDYSGRMLQGQTTHLHDEIHPAILPNGKIWSDIILYELRQSIHARE